MSRLAVLLAVLTLVVAPPAALAQDPFSPLPPGQPTPAPTPQPQADEDLTFTRTTLILIGLGVIGAFGGVIWWITRDARRNLTEEDRRAVDRERAGLAGEPGERRMNAKAKKKARQKAKAQRAARRRNR